MATLRNDHDTLVHAIYDCAVDPDMWPTALTKLRDHFDGAYAEMSLVDFNVGPAKHPRCVMSRNSDWDKDWLAKIPQLLNIVPGRDTVFAAKEDTPWSRLSTTPEEHFIRSDFYNVWSRPQKLKDCMNIRFLRKPGVSGMLTIPRLANREPYSAEECIFAARLTPHVRRAFLINELLAQGRQTSELYRETLDSLSVAVIIVGAGRTVVYANAAAEGLFSAGQHLALSNRQLVAHRVVGPTHSLDSAIDAALGELHNACEGGRGIPLLGLNGERVAAYVLPLTGNQLRGAFTGKHCAVIVSRPGQQHPMAMEILRTMFDMTVAEARVALLLSKGDGPQAIADSLGISVHTVRSHLKHAYAKSGVADQTGLSALVNTLMPPIA